MVRSKLKPGVRNTRAKFDGVDCAIKAKTRSGPGRDGATETRVCLNASKIRVKEREGERERETAKVALRLRKQRSNDLPA